jgi:hypothetical protein
MEWAARLAQSCIFTNRIREHLADPHVKLILGRPASLSANDRDDP